MYTAKTLDRIPTGSLYLACRKGPMSLLSAKYCGTPYDMVGIVFQSRTTSKGTYVFTLTKDNSVVLDLAALVRDDTIIHHAVLPLKDCDQETRTKRVETLKRIFTKYHEMHPVYSYGRVLASYIGLWPDSRDPYAMTPAELVARIAHEAGLIAYTGDTKVSVITPEYHSIVQGVEEEALSSIRQYLKPTTTTVIPFGDLTVMDLLHRYYENPAPASSTLTQLLTKSRGGVDDTVEMVTARYLPYPRKSRLDMYSYCEKLVPIELSNDPDADCLQDVDKECDGIRACLSTGLPKCARVPSDLLAKICQRTSQLAQRLYTIAKQLRLPIDTGDRFTEDVYHITTLDDNDSTMYYIVLYKKWRCTLQPVDAPKDKVCAILSGLVQDLDDLLEHTPVPFIRDLVETMTHQARAMLDYFSNL